MTTNGPDSPVPLSNGPDAHTLAAAANQRGVAALATGRPADAIAAFKQAVELDTSAGALWRNLASAHRANQDNRAELAALETAIELDQRDLMAWIRRAEVHERMDEPGLAFRAWSAAVQLAGGLNVLPPPLQPLIAKGHAYLATATAAIDARVAADTADLMTRMDSIDSRRFGAFIDVALRGRPVFQNQCAGLHYPFLPADEFFDRHHFAWFDAFEAATDDIRRELQGLIADPGDLMRPYVRMEQGTPASIWSSLDHRLDWTACFLWEYGMPNQPVLDRCPATAAALAAIPGVKLPGRAPNAFFSILRPRTRIPPHTGVTNTRAIIHLPLMVPEGCGFRVGGETRPWIEGLAFAFDDTIEHEAWNDSDELRAVLITDAWNPHLSSVEISAIARYFDAADASGFAPPMS